VTPKGTDQGPVWVRSTIDRALAAPSAVSGEQVTQIPTGGHERSPDRAAQISRGLVSYVTDGRIAKR
jgi:hypothetical protein